MILDSKPVIEGEKIIQVTNHACLNEKCAKYKQITDTTRNEIG